MSGPTRVTICPSDPRYGELKDLLIEATGLGYYSTRDKDLAGILEKRFEAAGVETVAQYLGLMRGRDRDPAEFNALVSALTIGETCFFRHPAQMEKLEREVLPEIFRRNAAARTLRIWTAGCSNGAETYSLAMLLERRFGKALSGWTVRLAGTDIDVNALAQARSGRYTNWALRATPPAIRAHCFQSQGEAWCVRPEFMRNVEWRHSNLTEALPPRWASQFDLVLCRSVLIYLSPRAARAAAANLASALHPQGWLMLGYADGLPPCGSGHGLERVDALGLYRARQPQEDPPRREASAPGSANAIEYRPVPAVRFPKTAACSNAGPEADLRFQAVLTSHALDPRVHFYYGLYLASQGRSSEGEQAFRRALHLNPAMALAHFHLGLMMEGRKEMREATRCYCNVLKSLARETDAALLVEDGGLTAGELSAMAESHLEGCR